jgi:hypothetical protein
VEDVAEVATEALLLLDFGGEALDRRAGMIWKASSGLRNDTDFLRAEGRSVCGLSVLIGAGVADIGMFSGRFTGFGVGGTGALTMRFAAGLVAAGGPFVGVAAAVLAAVIAAELGFSTGAASMDEIAFGLTAVFLTVALGLTIALFLPEGVLGSAASETAGSGLVTLRAIAEFDVSDRRLVSGAATLLVGFDTIAVFFAGRAVAIEVTAGVALGVTLFCLGSVSSAGRNTSAVSIGCFLTIAIFFGRDALVTIGFSVATDLDACVSALAAVGCAIVSFFFAGSSLSPVVFFGAVFTFLGTS